MAIQFSHEYIDGPIIVETEFFDIDAGKDEPTIKAINNLDRAAVTLSELNVYARRLMELNEKPEATNNRGLLATWVELEDSRFGDALALYPPLVSAASNYKPVVTARLFKADRYERVVVDTPKDLVVPSNDSESICEAAVVRTSREFDPIELTAINRLLGKMATGLFGIGDAEEKLDRDTFLAVTASPYYELG